MANENAQFDFLKDFIQQLFDDSGFASLSEEARKQYVPMFTAEAERRVGLVLLPKLNAQQSEELIQITEGDATPEQLREFWRASVPDFDSVVESTLADFAIEFKSLVGQA